MYVRRDSVVHNKPVTAITRTYSRQPNASNSSSLSTLYRWSLRLQRRRVKPIGSIVSRIDMRPLCFYERNIVDRFSVTSVPFAQQLHSVILPHLPSFEYPASARGPRSEGPRPPHSLNSNIRVYKYTPDQYFGPHYDDSVRDPETGGKSEWTLLIYLTGVEDGVLGGEVPILHRQNHIATQLIFQD